MSTTKYFAPSVEYAAKILIYLSRYKSKQSTLTEISKNLDINKSACLRVLKTLEANNFVYYNSETKKYSLGTYISVLGKRVGENLDYLRIINQFLEEVCELTGLTAALVQRVSFDRVMFISQYQTQIQPRLSISVGNRFPLTEVSYGKWILANVSKEERNYHLREGLKKVTSYTRTNLQEYIEELSEIKRSNILVSRQEYTNNVTAISSALYDWKGQILGMIALVGVSSLIDEAEEQRLCTVLKEVTNRCNEHLIQLKIEAYEFPYESKITQ